MSLRGMTVSQFDAPFSQARSTVLRVFSLATWPSLPQALLLAHSLSFLSGWRIPVVVPRLLLGSHGIASLFCLQDGFMSPRPPLRTGNAGRSRSASEQLRLMSDGIAYPRLHALKAAVDSQDPVVFS